MAKVILSRDDKVYRGGANAMLRVSMRASLHQLRERLGVTTIHLTHEQVEAMTLGHRVCVTRDGRPVSRPAAALIVPIFPRIRR